MPRRLFVSFVFALVFAFSHPVAAQVTNVTGDQAPPVPGVGHDYIHMLSETVNPANGSLSIRIGIPTSPGRGLAVPFTFGYDSNSALHRQFLGWSDNKDYLAQGGWSYLVPLLTMVKGTYSHSNPSNGGPYTCTYYKDYMFIDLAGQSHALGISNGEQSGTGGNCQYIAGSWQPSANGYLGGGDARVQASTSELNGDVSTNPAPVTVADEDGTVYYFSNAHAEYGTGIISSLPDWIEDRNGNKVTFSDQGNGEFTITDTLGGPVISTAGFFGAVTVAGLSKALPVTTTSVNPSLSQLNLQLIKFFAQDTCGGSGAGNLPPYSELSSIGLPNGQSYQFQYDATTGMLNKLIYPDGGYVRYVWEVNPLTDFTIYPDPGDALQGYDCEERHDTFAVASRFVSYDGTHEVLDQEFTYNTDWITGSYASNSLVWDWKSTTVTSKLLPQGTSYATKYKYNATHVPVPPNEPWVVGSATTPLESEIDYYDFDGSLLRTVTETYTDRQLPPTTKTTILPNGYESQTKSSYSSTWSASGWPNENPINSCSQITCLAVLTDQFDYDFGSTPNTVGPQLRNTHINYAPIAATPIFVTGVASIVDKPSQVIIYGTSTGNRLAETDYAYDGAAVSAATATQHDESNYPPSLQAPRGNLTTITKQCFPNCKQYTTSYSASVKSYTYDETGHVLSMLDACGNAACNNMATSTHLTQYGYTDSNSWCSGAAPPAGSTNAYLTSITNPLGQATTFCYGYDDGQLRGSKDVNSQVTTYVYGDLLARLTNINPPIGGTTITYDDTTLGSPKITTLREIQAGQNVTNEKVYDGMGHLVDDQLLSSPACATVHKTTSYFGNGWPHQVSNPYCSTGDTTYGLTTSSYDGLGRTKSVTHPDGASVQTTYPGRATVVSDEGNGNGTNHVTRVSQVDGLGRLTTVCEITSNAELGSGGTPTACGQDAPAPYTTGFLTAYSYDALGNLLGVNQGSLSARSFTYNSLSELVCSANPEIQPVTCPASDGGVWVSGTTRYTYDLNGNLITKTSPAPNQTSASVSVTTSYGDDALNRRTRVYPPNGEPETEIFYDGTWGGGDRIGRMTAIGRLDTSDNSWYTFRQFTYDALGRVTLMNECTVQDCPGTNWGLTFGYDFLGDTTSWTNGFGTTFSATYDNAQQLKSVTNNLSNANYPSPMFSASSTTAYNAPGELHSATIGTGSASIAETRGYDTRLRPTTLTDGSVYSFGITTYAPNGNILAVTDSANGSWAYGSGTSYTGSYDDMNRLLMAAPVGQTWSYSYAYDRYGNR